MKFLSLQPFVPSGKDFEKAVELFSELGFNKTWSDSGYAGFERDGARFILQKFDNREFAENLMINVKIDNATAFWKELTDKKLDEKFGISIGRPTQQPYGKEVNVIDIAGVCWHFVE